MKQPVVVPFEPWHAHLLKPIENSEFKALEIAGDLDYFSQAYTHTSLLAFTGLVGGYCIGMAGIFPLWDGVAEAWMFGSDLFPKYPKFIFKHSKQIMDMAFRHFDIHRLQAAVAVDKPINRRFVEKLGFVDEGIMRKYGTRGTDYIRYAKVV